MSTAIWIFVALAALGVAFLFSIACSVATVAVTNSKFIEEDRNLKVGDEVAVRYGDEQRLYYVAALDPDGNVVALEPVPTQPPAPPRVASPTRT